MVGAEGQRRDTSGARKKGGRRSLLLAGGLLAIVVLVLLLGRAALLRWVPGGNADEGRSDPPPAGMPEPNAPAPAPPSPPEPPADRARSPGSVDESRTGSAERAEGEGPAAERLRELVSQARSLLERGEDTWPPQGDQDLLLRCPISAELRSLLWSLPPEACVGLLVELSDEEFIAVGRILPYSAMEDIPGAVTMGELDSLEAFPEGIRDYLRQCATGAHGLGRMTGAMYLLEFCKHCPPEMFEAATRTLLTSTSPVSRRHAVEMLYWSDQSLELGDEELRTMAQAEPDPEARLRALLILGRRSEAHVRDLILPLLIVGGPDTRSAVAALRVHYMPFAGQAVRPPNPELEAAIQAALVPLYSASAEDPSFRKVIVECAVGLPAAAADTLEALARTEEDPRLQQALRDAARGVATAENRMGLLMALTRDWPGSPPPLILGGEHGKPGQEEGEPGTDEHH